MMTFSPSPVCILSHESFSFLPLSHVFSSSPLILLFHSHPHAMLLFLPSLYDVLGTHLPKHQFIKSSPGPPVEKRPRPSFLLPRHNGRHGTRAGGKGPMQHVQSHPKLSRHATYHYYLYLHRHLQKLYKDGRYRKIDSRRRGGIYMYVILETK